MKPTMPKQARRLRGLRESEPNGVVEVVELGTDHRLSLAQNPVLLAGQIAILLASSNCDVSRLRKRRQLAGREEICAGDSESRAQFGRTPRAVRQPLQDVVRHLGTALFQKPSCFVMLLIIDQTSLPQRADHSDPKTSPLYPKDPMSPPQRPTTKKTPSILHNRQKDQ